MGAASLVLLSGCSAGGLASLQHCDRLAAILQQSSSQSETSEGAGAEEREERAMEGRGGVGGGPVVKCMGDAGFFLDSEDVGGVRRMRERFKAVVETQMVAKLSPFLPTTRSLHPPPHRRRRLSSVLGGAVGAGEGGTEEVGERGGGDGDGEVEEGDDGESGSGEETGGEDERGSEEEKGSEEGSESEERTGGEEQKEENEEGKGSEGGARGEENEEEEEGEGEEKQSSDEPAVQGQNKGLDVGVIGRGFEEMGRDALGALEGEAFSSHQVAASASRNGALLLSCHLHCMALASQAWHGAGAPRVGGKTMAEAIGDWYFDRKLTMLVDCPFPCNPTCLLGA
ncbi:unnamed protein product [Closterium sp. NIES-53]